MNTNKYYYLNNNPRKIQFSLIHKLYLKMENIKFSLDMNSKWTFWKFKTFTLIFFQFYYLIFFGFTSF